MLKNRENVDFLVIGAGVVGINIAIRIKEKYPDASVTVLEKERQIAMHASGRNSGVLHAGIYYDKYSLKARFVKEGNRSLRNYCIAKGLTVNQCGKLVVAEDEKGLQTFEVLKDRAQANDVELVELDGLQARDIEPRVKTHGKALFSPSTATVDPVAVMSAFYQDACDLGIRFAFDTRYVALNGRSIDTSKGRYEAAHVINCAGLYADRVAHDFGVGLRYRVVPFKGVYLKLHVPQGFLRTNIYPVPDLHYPFLGVHFTVDVEGRVKIGPTAIPALWREQYHWYENFSLRDLLEVGGSQLGMLFRPGSDYRHLAWEEIKKYSKRYLLQKASALAQGVGIETRCHWGGPGIRAQLIDMEKGGLEMDFVVERGEQSVHVLNSVSPAFTCCIPFSDYVCNQISI